jgi:ribosomal-protein-alanine N-acetyltransferase
VSAEPTPAVPVVTAPAPTAATAAPTDVTLAPLRRRHLRGVLRIEEQVYPRPWSMALFLSELAMRDQRTYLVAKVDGVPVGYGGVMYVLPDAHVTTIAVDPAFQHRAVGTRLLLALTRAAVAKGAAALTLEVRVSNTAAQALYRRFGFAPAGVRKGYYADTGEDAIVMWAHDIDAPAYAARLDAIAATVPGRTTVEPAGSRA